MKIGTIVEPNEKGQIVIPHKLREALGITSETPLNLVLREEGIYMYPIEEVLIKAEVQTDKSAYLELLKKTRGVWSGDKTWEKTRTKRRRIELAAAKRRRASW